MGLFRFVFSGVLGNAEQFVHTLGFQSDDTTDPADVSSLGAAFLVNMVGSSASPVRDLWNNQTVIWTNVRTNEINPVNGKNLRFVDEAVNLPGHGSGNSLPYEVACAVTLRSNLATRSGRGRFYLPPFTVATTGIGGVFNAAQITTLVSALKTAFDQLATPTHRPVILSQPVAQGAVTPHNIIRFDVGSTPDSQRRRRNKVVEQRQGFPIDYAA